MLTQSQGNELSHSILPNSPLGLREQTAELASLALEEGFYECSYTQGSPDSRADAWSQSGFKPRQDGTSARSQNLSSPKYPHPSLETWNSHADERPSGLPASDLHKQTVLTSIFNENREEPEETDSFFKNYSNPTCQTPLLQTAPNNHYTENAFYSRREEPTFESRPQVTWKSLLKRSDVWIKDSVTTQNVYRECIVHPVSCLPSVFLGLLLNVLDGLSYGLILFPLANPIFANLGPAGLSIFYVSCIVSQLVFSLGASSFHSGIGSEMIEVVPFFHAMASTLVIEIGENKPKSVIATTITAYALSSVVTGLVFFALGYARLGSLIGFFPRHILVGCIGGVGWFLIITAIEVTSQIDGTVQYNFTTLKFLFHGITLLRWTIPMALAFALLIAQKFVKQPLLVPGYFIAVFVLFHLVVVAIPSLTYQEVRDAGWLFQSPDSKEPWWNFYTLYDFTAIDYIALLRTIPAMFALTFFGILHVPINVPALATSIGKDDVDLDKELIAHGISNALSGLVGSVQNYLVYTNSLLFIRTGAEGRLPGVMLAIATFGIMVAGPGVIGFIPIMVVGALIFLLGFELVAEALIDTYGRVSQFEYGTIIVIVVTMGTVDFVTGILVGVILACVTMVVQTSQRSAIKSTYTGAIARSTVRRNPVQQEFLTEVGDQIYVLKLSGNLFFGTIVRVEEKVRHLLDDEYFHAKPIRYLILDMMGVTAIDFSAAEAFARMKRLLDTKAVFMLISGVVPDSPQLQSLKGVGLLENTSTNPNCYKDDEENTCGTYKFDSVRLFSDLNSALEWSENQFLQDYYERREYYKRQVQVLHQHLEIPKTSDPWRDPPKDFANSPRGLHLQKIADKTARFDPQVHGSSRRALFKQPLSLFMQTFKGFSDKKETFWFAVTPFFKREEIPAGTVLYSSDTKASGFYVVETGILRAYYELQQGRLYETILAGTTCGELPFFSETTRTATVKAETDAVVWNLDQEAWERLLAKQVSVQGNHDRQNAEIMEPDGLEMALELYRIALKLTVERFTSVMAYTLVSASR